MATSIFAVLAVVMLPQGQAPKVTVDLKDASPKEAITMIAKAAKLPCVFSGDLPDKPTVTSAFQETDAVEALKLVCDAANLIATVQDAKGREVLPGHEELPAKLVIRRSAVSLAMDGGNARVLGVARAGDLSNALAAVRGDWSGRLADFQGYDKLVDLEVKDAPLREAMEKISKASGVAIEVDETVSKEIKVSATIRKMPLREVLSLLVNQANLTYTVENTPDPEVVRGLEARFKAGLMPRTEYDKELRDAPQIPTIHIVPKPELKVTGVPAGAVGAFDFDDMMRGLGGKEAETVMKLPGGELRLRALGLRESAACPKCHKSFMRAPGADFCPYCGAKLPAEKPKVDGD